MKRTGDQKRNIVNKEETKTSRLVSSLKLLRNSTREIKGTHWKIRTKSGFVKRIFVKVATSGKVVIFGTCCWTPLSETNGKVCRQNNPLKRTCFFARLASFSPKIKSIQRKIFCQSKLKEHCHNQHHWKIRSNELQILDQAVTNRSKDLLTEQMLTPLQLHDIAFLYDPISDA